MKLNHTSIILSLLPGLILSGTAQCGTITVGDDLLSVTLDYGNKGLIETQLTTHNTKLDAPAAFSWMVDTDKGLLNSASAEAALAKPTESRAKEAVFVGQNKLFRWMTKYKLSAPGFITKQLSIEPTSQLTVRRVTMQQIPEQLQPITASTSLLDIAVFCRHQNVGLFASLDFPYSKVRHEGGQYNITYPPYITLKADETYTSHSLTLGATEVTGKQRYGYYEGEVEAMDRYVQSRVKPRFDKPMFTSACIVNRYTQIQNGAVFYTMKDHPTLSVHQDIMRREIDLLPKLGIEYYQIFPGVFDWVPSDPKPEVVEGMVAYAKKRGVHIGDYSGTTSVFCQHYNQYNNSLQGTDLAPCFGYDKFQKWYTSTVVNNCKRYGFDMHALDFLSIGPCQSTAHGHPVGEDSIYSQVKGLMDFAEAVNATSPNMMIWPNSGCWSELLPKLAWYTPCLYLTDPFIASPWQGLNMTRLLDDARREQMVNLHYSRFLPYRYYTNCQYFFSQNSVVPDIRKNYEYGALSTIAVTPNICLAEVRPWYEELSPTNQAKVQAFYTKWTKFLKKNYSLWTKTYHLGDDPQPGGVEIYSHAQNDRGFIFIVNPNYWSKEVEIPLDQRLGFTGDSSCELAELYPTERLRMTEFGPYVKIGQTVKMTAAAQEVIVLEVKPSPKRVDKPRLYGLNGSVSKNADGYLVKTTGFQGTTENAMVVLPKGSAEVKGLEIRTDMPEMDRRHWPYEATKAKLTKSDAETAQFELTFRRQTPTTEIRQWYVMPGKLDEGIQQNWQSALPTKNCVQTPLAAEDGKQTGALAHFGGAYVDNAFGEMQPTEFTLTTRRIAASKEAKQSPVASPILVSPAKLGTSSSWWCASTINLPFINAYGCEPGFYDHPILVLPTLANPAVAKVLVWINGQAVNVQDYLYPRNRGYLTRWVDLMGVTHMGENSLVIYYEEKQ